MDRYSWAGYSSWAKGANDGATGYTDDFSVRIFCLAAGRTTNNGGRTILPTQAIAQDGRLGLLRPQNPSRAQNQVGRYGRNPNASGLEPRTVRKRWPGL